MTAVDVCRHFLSEKDAHYVVCLFWWRGISKLESFYHYVDSILAKYYLFINCCFELASNRQESIKSVFLKMSPPNDRACEIYQFWNAHTIKLHMSRANTKPRDKRGVTSSKKWTLISFPDFKMRVLGNVHVTHIVTRKSHSCHAHCMSRAWAAQIWENMSTLEIPEESWSASRRPLPLCRTWISQPCRDAWGCVL